MSEKYNNGCGKIPVSVAAKVLQLDDQTVRLLLQKGLVDWGIAYRKEGSKHFSYLIYSQKFYEVTGFRYKGGELL